MAWTDFLWDLGADLLGAGVKTLVGGDGGSSGAPNISPVKTAFEIDTTARLTSAADYRKTLATKAVGFVKEQQAAPKVANSNAADMISSVVDNPSIKEFYSNLSRQQQQAQSQGPRQINV